MTLDLATQQPLEGMTVFSDDNDATKFYVMPNQPRFRIDADTKKPVFKLMKYKLPVDRPDGKKGGGFVVFDCEFVVPDDKLKKIQATLDAQVQQRGFKNAQGQPLKAQINHIPYTDATASVQLLDTSGVLVSKINTLGKPSLFGSMICPVTAELTPEGATVLEATMKSAGGSGAQVTYDLHFPATFPPISGYIWFDASKAYSFYQRVDKHSPWLADSSENDTLREEFKSSNSGGQSLDFGNLGFITDPDLRKKVQDDVTNWANGQVEEAMKALVLPDIKPADDRGDHDKDHITKSQSMLEQASFRRQINERMGVSFNSPQGGTLPSIVDMGFKWEDFYVEIDANDPFFATVQASIAVNADFDRYGIASVDAHCEYTKTNPATVKDFHFTKPDDIGKFDSDTANGDMHYAYSFAVNYKDQAKSYQAPLVTTNAGQVTINANALGILYISMAVGNVDFTKIPQVMVSVTYPDADANGQPINQQFVFDKDKKADHMIAVVLKTVDKPHTHQITYILTDGTQVATTPVSSTASTIFINSPFINKTYSFLAEGDFNNGIDNIFLKMKYTDAANNIEQEMDFTFNLQNRQKDWAVPAVANGKGQMTYTGVIMYKNHTTENLPETTTTSDLITFGPPNQVIVSVIPDTALVDFTKVVLVKVDFEYADPAHQIDLKQEYVLKQSTTPQPWTFYARDPTLTSYTWSATFFMAGSPPKAVKVPASTSSDTDLLLTMPD